MPDIEQSMQELQYQRLCAAYVEVIGSTPDTLGDAVIQAIVDDTEGDATALVCWQTILSTAIRSLCLPD